MKNNSIKDIAIVGVGEIGSRHLQALSQCDFNSKLYCIDPSIESLERAKNRLNKYPKNPNIHSIIFEKSIDVLPSALDFSIIATCADVRFQVLSDLLERVQVKNLLLEKILFQNTNDIMSGNQLLKDNNTQAWVNCSRQMWWIYKILKEFLKDKSEISFDLYGGMWGMGCNAIHMIDLFEWLTNSKLLDVNIDSLDPIIHESKRAGFIEFSGSLGASYTRHNEMLLHSDLNNRKSSYTIVIQGKDFTINIEESLGKVKIITSNKENKDLEEISKFDVPFQSQLSHLVATEAIFNNNSQLTPYTDSADQHTLLIKALTKQVEEVLGKPLEDCPIT